MHSPRRLDAAPDTVHWGFFDATLSPQLTIESGEFVTISTVSGGVEQMPKPPLQIPAALTAIQEKVTRKMVPGHICTGPVAVNGAKPGHCAARATNTTARIVSSAPGACGAKGQAGFTQDCSHPLFVVRCSIKRRIIPV
jgi:acetamidase/formamidase